MPVEISTENGCRRISPTEPAESSKEGSGGATGDAVRNPDQAVSLVRGEQAAPEADQHAPLPYHLQGVLCYQLIYDGQEHEGAGVEISTSSLMPVEISTENGCRRISPTEPPESSKEGSGGATADEGANGCALKIKRVSPSPGHVASA
jgi:hypothetical protein